jgi:hypothetical protein
MPKNGLTLTALAAITVLLGAVALPTAASAAQNKAKILKSCQAKAMAQSPGMDPAAKQARGRFIRACVNNGGKM